MRCILRFLYNMTWEVQTAQNDMQETELLTSNISVVPVLADFKEHMN